eukprot:768354-Hanusia_phi.AAC.6
MMTSRRCWWRARMPACRREWTRPRPGSDSAETVRRRRQELSLSVRQDSRRSGSRSQAKELCVSPAVPVSSASTNTESQTSAVQNMTLRKKRISRQCLRCSRRAPSDSPQLAGMARRPSKRGRAEG